MADRPPRRSSFWIRLELGLASFAPAFALLAVRSRSTGWFWLFAAVAAGGVVVLATGALIVARGAVEPFEFNDIKDLGGDVLGHVGAYLAPALIDTNGSTEQILISAVVVVLIVQIHVATGRVYVNPLLYLIGYRVYQASSGGGTFYLIARSDVSTWTSARRCIQIGASVLVERHRP